MKLGLILRKWRLASNVTQRSLARQIGLSAATLQRIEYGEMMDGDSLAKIMQWLMNSEPLPESQGRRVVDPQKREAQRRYIGTINELPKASPLRRLKPLLMARGRAS